MIFQILHLRLFYKNIGLDCDFESDSDSDVNYGDIIDADLVETNVILEVAVFLSVIYGLIMIGLVVFAIVYRQKKKNQFLDS